MNLKRTPSRLVLSVLMFGTLVMAATVAFSQTARDILGAPPVSPITNEPAARIVIDPPLAGPLAAGRVIIQYRAVNLRIVPVFGAAALDVSPRIGHVHVTVDDLPWRWADTGGGLLIVNGFTPGPHKILLELADASHRVLDSSTVNFIVPDPAQPGEHAH